MKLPIRMLCLAALVVSANALAQQAPRSVTPELLSKYWVLIAATLEANVPVGGFGMDQPGCAAVTFVVEKTGRTSNIKVQRIYPPGDLATVAASAAESLEFEPTMNNAGRDRVFSSLIFPFNMPPDPDARKAIMQRCVIKPMSWSDPAAGIASEPGS